MGSLDSPIADRSARGIAHAVAEQINSGSLAYGQRLPTVRTLAHELGVSTTTVAQAWSLLARAGLVEGRGKAGTTVIGSGPLRNRTRYASLAHAPAATIDLSLGVPDPELLPDVRRSLRRITRNAEVGSYFEPTVLSELKEVLESSWPYPPQALTIVNGAVDGIARVIDVTTHFGAAVAVENPTFSPILDLLEAKGARVVGIEVDDEGPRPDALAAALKLEPTLLVLQPRAHNPRGHAMTPARASTLAKLIGPSGPLILEDDHAAHITSAPPVSLGTTLPERTLTVRSFSKSHGPDLRLAALGGAGHVIEQVISDGYLGPGWSSHLLQALLVDMLTDDVAVNTVQRARETYHHRGVQLVTALRERDVHVEGADGLNMWVQVTDERAALTSLGLHGIAVAPGSPFEVTALDTQHIRVTYAQLKADIEQVADALRAAAHTRGYRQAR